MRATMIFLGMTILSFAAIMQKLHTEDLKDVILFHAAHGKINTGTVEVSVIGNILGLFLITSMRFDDQRGSESSMEELAVCLPSTTRRTRAS
jgi:hypothetical protein